MSAKSDAVIILFQDSVSPEQVKKYAEDVVDNGGTVKDRYWESGMLNGFSATIPQEYLQAFRSFRGDEIKSIEGDQVVTIQ